MLIEIVLLNKYKMTLLYNLENTIYMTFPHIDILLFIVGFTCFTWHRLPSLIMYFYYNRNNLKLCEILRSQDHFTFV